MPRWTFEKFPEADETLTTQMKSVGEAMSIGRTFKESLQKAIRSMEVKRFGLGLDANDWWLQSRRGSEEESSDWPVSDETLVRKLGVPSQGRLYYIRYAMRSGYSIDRIYELTGIDRWFLDQIAQLVEFEDQLLAHDSIESLPPEIFREAKQLGYSDPQLAFVYFGKISTDTILEVRRHRKALGIEPVYKLVDTCAAEFEAITPYYYSTYERPFEMVGSDGSQQSTVDDEASITSTPKIVILGGGPNRIGQGIEFDYCCCHAAFACENMGFESVMVNSNPETVSTDFDTSDHLFFEPLTLEDVLNIVERINGGGIDVPDRGGSVVGCIVQFGGQTPLNLAHGLVAAGVPLIGTGLDSIDLAEDRDRFKAVLDELGMRQPENGIAHSLPEAVEIASGIGYPVLVRPSYVLGGRGMETCYDEASLKRYMIEATGASDLADAPVLIDRFLGEAVEVDVDVIADFEPSEGSRATMIDLPAAEPRAVVCGVMEHIEEAGVHSGDSTCTIPPYSLPKRIIKEIKKQACDLARRLSVRGLMNMQLAVKDGEIYILEVNPRASRTAPFVSKAKGIPWPRFAAQVMMGASMEELEVSETPDAGFFSVKQSVFPFEKFPGVDVILGPEMRSTGEVMGADPSLPLAVAKAGMSAGLDLPVSGTVFLSVRESDKPHAAEIARGLKAMGFQILSTGGTHETLRRLSIDADALPKISEGTRPNILDLLADSQVDLIVNTASRKGSNTDEGRIRAMAVRQGVPMITTIPGARAAVQAIAALKAGAWGVNATQDYFPSLKRKHVESV